MGRTHFFGSTLGRGMVYLKNKFPRSLLFHSICNLQVKVSDIINGGKWNLPAAMKRTVPYIAQNIEETNIKGGQDYIVWSVTTSGEYELKATYEGKRH